MKHWTMYYLGYGSWHIGGFFWIVTCELAGYLGKFLVWRICYAARMIWKFVIYDAVEIPLHLYFRILYFAHLVSG